MGSLTIYTDGGCIGNPGVGGWAFVLLEDGKTTEHKGAEALTTNNRMELTAVIEALEYIRQDVPGVSSEAIRIVTDSEYVRRGISEWILTWIRNGWKTSGRAPVKNQDLWKRLHVLQEHYSISWDWVKGHSGNQYNEMCDQLVHDAIDSLKK
ncbi:MAG TPA: ribonuclease HI [Spirochaetia bacterium]|nr:ribonuclease HI [Spirochaetia bacterium]